MVGAVQQPPFPLYVPGFTGFSVPRLLVSLGGQERGGGEAELAIMSVLQIHSGESISSHAHFFSSSAKRNKKDSQRENEAPLCSGVKAVSSA